MSLPEEVRAKLRKPKPRIRVISHQDLVTNAEISHLGYDEEGNETLTDISGLVQFVDLKLHVGEFSRATIGMVFPMVEVTAEVEDVILEVMPVDRIPEVVERLWQHFDEHDVTVNGDTNRRRM